LRILRVIRVFRVLKLVRYLVEGSLLIEALRASRVRISVFLFAVMILVVIVGSAIYVIEGAQNGFTSIPRSVYWAIVTLTTVGYGDISPQTPLGQALAAMVMILGYGMIAVPTGIVTVEYERQRRIESETNRCVETTEACPACGRDLHDPDASFCKYCGGKL
jgi:voltage-gated potassium channel